MHACPSDGIAGKDFDVQEFACVGGGPSWYGDGDKVGCAADVPVDLCLQDV